MKKCLLLMGFLLIVFSPPLRAQTEIGLQLYSLRNEFKTEVAGTLVQIESWGIREIEVGGTYNLPMDEFKSSSDPQKPGIPEKPETLKSQGLKITLDLT